MNLELTLFLRLVEGVDERMLALGFGGSVNEIQ